MKYDNLCKKYIEYINLNCDNTTNNNNNNNNITQPLQCDLIQKMLDGCIKFKNIKQNNNQDTNSDNKPSNR